MAEEHDFADACDAAFDAVFATKLAYLFADDLGELLHDERVAHVTNNSFADDDMAAEAIESAERDWQERTPEEIGAMVAHLVRNERKREAAAKQRRAA